MMWGKVHMDDGLLAFWQDMELVGNFWTVWFVERLSGLCTGWVHWMGTMEDSRQMGLEMFCLLR